MIMLHLEMYGNLVPPSKLTTGTTSRGKSVATIPYARLPHMEQLKISGKADTTEDNSSDEHEVEVDGKKESREEREKCRMRGKGKSLSQYLRKQKKNVIDPTAVRFFFCAPVCLCHIVKNENMLYKTRERSILKCLEVIEIHILLVWYSNISNWNKK